VVWYQAGSGYSSVVSQPQKLLYSQLSIVRPNFQDVFYQTQPQFGKTHPIVGLILFALMGWMTSDFWSPYVSQWWQGMKPHMVEKTITDAHDANVDEQQEKENLVDWLSRAFAGTDALKIRPGPISSAAKQLKDSNGQWLFIDSETYGVTEGDVFRILQKLKEADQLLVDPMPSTHQDMTYCAAGHTYNELGSIPQYVNFDFLRMMERNRPQQQDFQVTKPEAPSLNDSGIEEN